MRSIALAIALLATLPSLAQAAPTLSGGDGAVLSVDGDTIRWMDSPLALRPAAWGRDALTPLPLDAPTRAAGDGIETLHPGITAWWQPHPRGVQLGFDVFDPPAGSGPLRIRLMSTLAARPDGEGADLGGGVASVGEVLAWDATGRPLPAWTEAHSGGIDWRVDDEGALYPLLVDPIVSVGNRTLSGTLSDRIGEGLWNAGDLDGDGTDDLISSNSDHDALPVLFFDLAPAVGQVRLHLGAQTGLATAPTWTWEAGQSGQRAGSATTVGDFDGDGRPDVAASLAYSAPLDTDVIKVFDGTGGSPWFSDDPTVGLSASLAAED